MQHIHKIKHIDISKSLMRLHQKIKNLVPIIEHKPKVNIIRGEQFNISKINTKKKNILILSLVKDIIINNNLLYIQQFYNNLVNNFGSVKYGILTNNNTDSTVDALKAWQKNDNNIFIVETLPELITVTVNNKCGNRILKLAEYRNKILEESIKYFGENFDYIIVLDTDIDDNYDISEIIKSISIDAQWSAISANNYYKNSKFHYDMLALRLLDQSLDIHDISIDFDKNYGKNCQWIPALVIFKDFVKVKAAFGGLTIYNAKEIFNLFNINKNIYDLSSLPEGTCEHIALDIKLKNSHFINSNLSTKEHNGPNKSNVEDHLYGKPLMIIPRDAGFFSVFNFIIGTISTGIRAYPYYNKELFLKHRDTHKHFCYWTDSENSWFDFFEPISFYDNDTEHTDKSFLKYSVSGAEMAPEEFRMPHIFKKMLQENSDIFQKWRNYHHSIFNEYIKIKQPIIDKTNLIFKSMFNQSDFIIGVHYRHPSHYIESGQILLSSYFEKIDQILDKNPNAKIFISSDNDFGILAFQKQYQDKIKYIKNIDRLPMNNILEWIFATINNGHPDEFGLIKNTGYQLHQTAGIDNNNKKMTEDLLIEVLCLSKCNILINSTSNIGLALSYINPNLNIVTL